MHFDLKKKKKRKYALQAWFLQKKKAQPKVEEPPAVVSEGLVRQMEKHLVKVIRDKKPLLAHKKLPDWRLNWCFRRNEEREKRKKELDMTSAFDNAEAFIHKLKKRGFVRLGSGAFSTVLAKPESDRVLKVNTKQDNWMDYIWWGTKKGYAGSYCPRVFSYKEIKTKEGKFYVSVMERMHDTFENMDRSKDAALFSPLSRLADKNLMAEVLFEEVFPGANKFMKDLQSSFARLDMHEGNLMFRKDGSVCLTDPVHPYANGGDYYTPVPAKVPSRIKARDFTLAS